MRSLVSVLAFTFLFVSHASAAHLDFMNERVYRLAQSTPAIYQYGTFSLQGALHAIKGYTDQSLIREIMKDDFYRAAVAVPYVFTRDVERRLRYSLAEQGLPINLTAEELLLLEYDQSNPLFTPLRKLDFDVPRKKLFYSSLDADNLFFVIDVVKRASTEPDDRSQIKGEPFRRIQERVNKYLQDHKRNLINVDHLSLSPAAQQALQDKGLRGALSEEVIKTALPLSIAAEIWQANEQLQSAQCRDVLAEPGWVDNQTE